MGYQDHFRVVECGEYRAKSVDVMRTRAGLYRGTCKKLRRPHFSLPVTTMTTNFVMSGLMMEGNRVL
jgi:hypothetical protein